MLFKELFIGDNKLFGVIFKQRYPEIYAEIFGDATNPDTFALVKFGNRTVLDSFNETNCKDYTGAILDMCVDTFKSQFEVFNKKYDFLKPVLQSTSTNRTVTVQESNTDVDRQSGSRRFLQGVPYHLPRHSLGQVCTHRATEIHLPHQDFLSTPEQVIFLHKSGRR